MTEPAGLDRFGRFVNRRELDALAGKLEDGESVLAAVEATRDRRGVLAATDRRLVFVRRGWLGARAEDWAYRQVLGVTCTARVDDATLTVRTQRGTQTFTAVIKAEAQAFEKAVAMRPRAPGELVEFAIDAAQTDRRKRLERLDRMLARGSITRTEYERSKRAIALETEDA
jgi:hypothetical protein